MSASLQHHSEKSRSGKTAPAKGGAESRASPVQALDNQAAIREYSARGEVSSRNAHTRARPEDYGVQAKLQISQAGDPLEREADRVADRVVAGGNSPIGIHLRGAGELQRKCTSCEEEDTSAGSIRLQRKESRGGTKTGSSPGINPSSLKQGGRPLAKESRNFFENRMQRDFSQVRIHTDNRAASMASAINARAFTHGNQIAFARGQYDPHSREGKHLLAHELTHTQQQQAGSTLYRNGDGDTDTDAADSADGSFDPCGLDVSSLSMTRFVQIFNRAKTFIDNEANRTSDEYLYYDYGNLMRRLAAERRARAGRGHIWLYEASSGVPAQLYRLVQGSGMGAYIYRVSGSEIAAMDAGSSTHSTMTEGQIHDFRQRNGIRQASLDDHFDLQDPSAIQQPLEFTLPLPEQPDVGSLLYDPAAPQYFDPFNGLLPGLNRPRDPISDLLYDPNAPHYFDPNQGFVGPGSGNLNPFGAVTANRGASHFGTSSLYARHSIVLSDPPGNTTSAQSYLKYRGSQGEVAHGFGSARGLVDFRALNAMNIQGMDTTRLNTAIAGHGISQTNAGGSIDRVSAGDLTRFQGNNPIWDDMGRGWILLGNNTLVSIKTIVPSDLSITTPGSTGWGTYDHGFDDIAGSPHRRSMVDRPNNPATRTSAGFFATALSVVNEGTGSNLTVNDAILRSQLAVNADHVEDFRARVRNRSMGLNTRSGPLELYRQMHDADLRSRPLDINGVRYSSVQDIITARSGNVISQNDYDVAVRQIADRAAARVVSNGITTTELRNIETLRRQHHGLGDNFNRIIAPEHLDAARTGRLDSSGTSNRVELDYRGATGRSMRRGGAAGLFFGGITDLPRLYSDPNYDVGDYSRNLAIGGAFASAEAGIESRLNVHISEAAAARAMANPAMASRIASITPLTRGLGSTGVGAVLTPAAVLTMMALDDQEYTSIDYYAAGARYSAGGAVAAGSGWLAAAGTGALLGSEVPLLGTAIGFIVGAGAFYLFDSTAGDSIDRGVRRQMGQQGCTGRRSRPEPASSSSSRSPPPLYHYCFAAGTKITMGDGSEKAIESLMVNEEVMAFDEREETFKRAKINKLHHNAPSAVLKITLSNQRVFRVTPRHRFYIQNNWVRAEDLSPGQICLAYQAGNKTSGRRESVSIEKVESSPVITPVYNLSIEKYHTYVAERVVVHNVKP